MWWQEYHLAEKDLASLYRLQGNVHCWWHSSHNIFMGSSLTPWLFCYYMRTLWIDGTYKIQLSTHPTMVFLEWAHRMRGELITQNSTGSWVGSRPSWQLIFSRTERLGWSYADIVIDVWTRLNSWTSIFSSVDWVDIQNSASIHKSTLDFMIIQAYN